MNFLEVVLLGISFLYAVILYRILTNVDINDRKVELMYKEVCGYVEDLRQRHNNMLEKQKEFSSHLLESVEKTIEDADSKRHELDKSFLSELERVKHSISQQFLRR